MLQLFVRNVQQSVFVTPLQVYLIPFADKSTAKYKTLPFGTGFW